MSDTGDKSEQAASGDAETVRDVVETARDVVETVRDVVETVRDVVETIRNVVETGALEVGDAEKAPEETFDSENKSTQAVSDSVQGTVGETVDTEMGAKEGEEEDEKTEEKAAADSASTVKESSSVEGDDPKKRFVALCLLETKMAICCIGSFVLAKFGLLFLEVKKKTFCAFVRFHL